MNETYAHGSKRLSDPKTANRYPLECSTDITWQKHGDDFITYIPLEELEENSILVPSFSTIIPHIEYKVTLIHNRKNWELPGPSKKKKQNQRHNQESRVSTHIDCFHIHEYLRHPTLEFKLKTSIIPEQFLVGCSWRPLTINKISLPLNAIEIDRPPSFSQYAEGGNIGPRICSPTSLTMVLNGYGEKTDVLSISDECYDPSSNLYGIWPKAIQAAQKIGYLGSIETFTNWEKAETLLNAGYPLVASIRFKAGELQGAPMRSTQGHLLVVHGTSPSEIRVNDPAALTNDSVNRTYLADEFSSAWLSYRGVAYVVLP